MGCLAGNLQLATRLEPSLRKRLRDIVWSIQQTIPNKIYEAVLQEYCFHYSKHSTLGLKRTQRISFEKRLHSRGASRF